MHNKKSITLPSHTVRDAIIYKYSKGNIGKIYLTLFILLLTQYIISSSEFQSFFEECCYLFAFPYIE